MASETAHLTPGAADVALDLEALRPLLTRIRDKYHPLQIWLFGSRARGDARPGSDWDLFVVVPDDVADAECHPLTIWQLQRNSGVHADVIACRASEVRADWDTVNTISYVVAHEGRLLYQR